MIYLDNAATSFPKPAAVWEAVADCGRNRCGNPGRSGHSLSLAAAREIFQARETVSRFFHIPDSARLVFTHNATHALNLAIYGFLQKGDHVLTSSMEHNSVMRPLEFMMRQGRISYTIVECDSHGELKPEAVRRALRPSTRLVALSHASNVCGTILPIKEVKALLPPAVFLLVDAAQTAGVLPIDAPALGIDLLAFSGHKGLLGPMGTGGLYIAPQIKLTPLMQGGTGSRSEETMPPDFLPDALEPGTPNVPGLCGLRAGVEFIVEQGIEKIRQREQELTALLLKGLAEMKHLILYGPGDAARQTAVVSLTVKGMDPAETVCRLEQDFGIAARAGLHCAPLAHRTLGSFPIGTVRFSLSYFNTEEEIEHTLRALERMR